MHLSGKLFTVTEQYVIGRHSNKKCYFSMLYLVLMLDIYKSTDIPCLQDLMLLGRQWQCLGHVEYRCFVLTLKVGEDVEIFINPLSKPTLSA